MHREFYCPYCQRFRLGAARLTGNHGSTPICEDCYVLRRRMRRQTAKKTASLLPRSAHGSYKT